VVATVFVGGQFHTGLAKRLPDGSLRPTRAAALLFAEDPAGILNEKCTVRIFHYRGDAVVHKENTNLVRPPKTIRGPLIVQIRDAVAAVVDELATGIQMGPLGFEVAQRYPVRVIKEAITNAIIHRDYFASGDIHVRIFDNRIEVESPGRFPVGVTIANIVAEATSHPIWRVGHRKHHKPSVSTLSVCALR
jgi:ATP-dependent DNA helicase RecG